MWKVWIWCVFNVSNFNKKTVIQFFEKGTRFTENLFQSHSIENVQNFDWCHLKPCRSRKRIAILKISSAVFRRTLCSFCWLWNETSKKRRFPSVKTKTNKNFAVKLAGRSNHSFLLSIWGITFFKHQYSLYVIKEFLELYWLCKHMKKVRSSQTPILVLNWVNCTKLMTFPCEYCQRSEWHFREIIIPVTKVIYPNVFLYRLF